MAAMPDLTLFDRLEMGQDGDVTWQIVPEQASHPLLANVPASFSFRTAFNFGPAHAFATQPVTVLMRDPLGHDAVAVREFGAGRVVGFKHAANFETGSPPLDTLANRNVQQLYIDGIFWAANAQVATNRPPSVSLPPASRTVALGRTAIFQVVARGSLPLAYQWHYNGVDLPGATNTSLVLSNVSLSQAGSYSVS